MKALLFAAPVLLLVTPAATAGDPDFKAIVRGVESNLGIRRMHIPVFGLAMFFVKAARPAGVRQLDMAVFEDLSCPAPDAARFETIMKQAVGDRWNPIIRVRERRGRELTYIYARPDGRNWKLIVATFEPSEAVLIHLKLNPEALLDSLDEPAHAGTCLRGTQ